MKLFNLLLKKAAKRRVLSGRSLLDTWLGRKFYLLNVPIYSISLPKLWVSFGPISHHPLLFWGTAVVPWSVFDILLVVFRTEFLSLTFFYLLNFCDFVWFEGFALPELEDKIRQLMLSARVAILKGMVGRPSTVRACLVFEMHQQCRCTSSHTVMGLGKLFCLFPPISLC